MLLFNHISKKYLIKVFYIKNFDFNLFFKNYNKSQLIRENENFL